MPGSEAVAWLAEGCAGDQRKSNRLNEPAEGEDIQAKILPQLRNPAQ